MRATSIHITPLSTTIPHIYIIVSHISANYKLDAGLFEYAHATLSAMPIVSFCAIYSIVSDNIPIYMGIYSC